jgi:hypothetical protein
MPPQERLWLDNEQDLFPRSSRSSEKDQDQTIGLRACRSFDLSAENNELLTEESVLDHEFGLASGEVCQRPQQERGSSRFCPANERVLERLKAKDYQPLDKDRKTMHSVRNPFVKMSRRMHLDSIRHLGNRQGARDMGRCSQRPH